MKNISAVAWFAGLMLALGGNKTQGQDLLMGREPLVSEAWLEVEPLLPAHSTAFQSAPFELTAERRDFTPSWTQASNESGGFEAVFRGQNETGGGGVDPSDPTQISPHLVTEFEWTKLADGDGDTVLVKWSPWIPLTEKSLFTIDVPLPTYSGTEILGNHTGIGDIRMRYFYLFKTQSDLITAIAPSIDAIAPTGDVDKGLGGGQWLIMPNIVTAISPAKNWNNFVFLRYVHSEGGVRGRTSTGGIDLPSDGLLDSERLRGLSLEWASVFQLQDAHFDYAMFTPDYFQNFSGRRSSTLQFKYELGKAITEKFWVLFEVWHPVAGEVSNDLSLKIKTDFYF
jgi:hypothetical protein